MTKEQIKAEIQQALDEIPEESLRDLLDYLNEVKSISSDIGEMSRNLKQILQEDKELLDRLA